MNGSRSRSFWSLERPEASLQRSLTYALLRGLAYLLGVAFVLLLFQQRQVTDIDILPHTSDAPAPTSVEAQAEKLMDAHRCWPVEEARGAMPYPSRVIFYSERWGRPMVGGEKMTASSLQDIYGEGQPRHRVFGFCP